jgi:hypothetical protein
VTVPVLPESGIFKVTFCMAPHHDQTATKQQMPSGFFIPSVVVPLLLLIFYTPLYCHIFQANLPISDFVLLLKGINLAVFVSVGEGGSHARRTGLL